MILYIYANDLHIHECVYNVLHRNIDVYIYEHIYDMHNIDEPCTTYAL